MQRPLIIYTGEFRFPTGDAGASRVLGIGKALRAIGYEVVFGGGEAEGRPEDWAESSGYSYQGFAYQSQGNLCRTHSGITNRIREISERSKNTLCWVDGYRSRGRLAGIIAYGPSTPLLLRLKRYTRRHKIPLIIDLTEWPTGCNLPGGTFGLRNMDSELRLRFLNRKSDGVIAISSFLAEYYRRSGCCVTRIPPLVDLDEQKWNAPAAEATDTIRLIYAGTPGHKDLLGNIIRGVLLANGRTRKFNLHLVGVTGAQASELSGCDLVSKEGSSTGIICYGRIAQNDVPAMLSRADFSVLLRPNSKNARAGFATKLVESLSAGTPVIANSTSDISEFVKDGREGFIAGGNSPEALAATLNLVAELPRERILEMRNNAKSRARESFDYRSYCSGLRTFLSKVPLRT